MKSHSYKKNSSKRSLLADVVITNIFLLTVCLAPEDTLSITHALLFSFLFCQISINPLIKGQVSSNKNNNVTVSVATRATSATVREQMSTDSPEPRWQS